MNRRNVIFAAWWVGVAVCSSAALAADLSGAPPAQVKREIIPGSELMTSKERERYRQRMQGAKSEEERNRYRDEHIRQMQERARLRGLRLADPAPGAGR